MSKRHNMTPDEAEELFSELDASGVLDPDRAAAREGRAKRRLFMRRTAGATAVAEREAADRERSRAREGKKMCIRDSHQARHWPVLSGQDGSRGHSHAGPAG